MGASPPLDQRCLQPALGLLWPSPTPYNECRHSPCQYRLRFSIHGRFGHPDAHFSRPRHRGPHASTIPAKGPTCYRAACWRNWSGTSTNWKNEPDCAGLIIRSGKPGSFIAGADLREFVASFDAPREQILEMCHRGRKLFARLSQIPAVTVAAIDGICVGGGAELAIWCDRRIMTVDAKTQFGFPEVKLGLFPGWGGTARSSRIVGLGNAVEMVTSGESIDAHMAAADGSGQRHRFAGSTVSTTASAAPDSVSSTALADRLLEAACRMVRAEAASGDYLADRQRWAGPVVESETELGFLGATASGYIQAANRRPLSRSAGRAGGHARRGRTAARRRLRSRGRGHGRPVRHAGQSGPDQCLLPHRPQQERSRGRPRRAWRRSRSARSASSGPASWGPASSRQSAPPGAGRGHRRRRAGPGRRRAARAGRSLVQQADQRARRRTRDPLRAAAQRHGFRCRDCPGRSGHRSGDRKHRREERRCTPGWSRCSPPTPSWRRTRRRFRSPSWPKA